VEAASFGSLSLEQPGVTRSAKSERVTATFLEIREKEELFLVGAVESMR
jgi:hypothetical protein